MIAFVQQCGFCDGVLADVESAVGEALANAAEHGDCNAGAGFDVSATFDEGRLVIEIKDNGAGFDAASALQSANAGGAGERGFGISLMRRLMDEVAYSDRGSRIQLIKRLDGACMPAA